MLYCIVLYCLILYYIIFYSIVSHSLPQLYAAAAVPISEHPASPEAAARKTAEVGRFPFLNERLNVSHFSTAILTEGDRHNMNLRVPSAELDASLPASGRCVSPSTEDKMAPAWKKSGGGRRSATRSSLKTAISAIIIRPLNQRKGKCMAMTELQSSLFHLKSEKGNVYGNDCMVANLVPLGIREMESVWQ